jgi:hypothetical protein
MKKIYLFIATLSCLFNTYATDYVVSGAFDERLNGVYVEAGIIDDKPYFVKAAENGEMEKGIAFMGCWRIGDHFGDGMVMGMEMSCDDGNPPLTGWGGGITIAPNGPNIKYIGSTSFKEQVSNNGTVKGEFLIVHNKLNGQGFAGDIGDEFVTKGFVSVSNLSEGLSLTITKISIDTLKALLSGQASNHSVDSDFTINFTDNAFSGGGTLAGTGGTGNKTFSINFIKELYVASSGAEFNTISAAVAAAGSGDIIHISGETYTESISTDKGLIFKGAGSDKTIIQAANEYNTATNRVFNVTSYNDTSEFHRLTVRFGKAEYGGGIFGYNMKIYKCRINNNIALSSSGSQSFGGGVAVQKYFELYDSEISENKCDNQNQSGQIMGGGIVCINNSIDTVKIVNSTFSNNFSRWAGGGIMVNRSKIINCTFTKNSASQGSGIYIQYPSSLVNSIVYGNTTNDVYVLQESLNTTNSIVGTSIGPINGSLSSADPILQSLANNGGTTQTHSLQEGSPAINAGATTADVPTKDQRGYNKVGTRDIGAFEFGATGQVDIALTENACSFFIFGEDTLRTSGAFTRMSGDTIYTLNLTIKNATTGSETVSNCGAYIWTVDGQTYTLSGTYTAVLTNAVGCDSTITLNLTIKEATTGSETVSNCGTYTWSVDGQTYTQSGTYTAVLTNAAGCDSTITLNLTLHQATTGSETITQCKNYKWAANGQTYTQSGVYTATLKTVNGCDSVVTLNLTILPTSIKTENATACVSYTWNGKTYSKSGTYWFTGKNSLGCDSIVKLVLTITPSNLPKPVISGPSILCASSRALYTSSVSGGNWKTNDAYLNLYSIRGIVRNAVTPPSDMYKSSISYSISNADKTCKETTTKSVWIKLNPASLVKMNITSANLEVQKELTLTSNIKNGTWKTVPSTLASVTKINNTTGKIKGLARGADVYAIYQIDDTVKKCTYIGMVNLTITKSTSMLSASEEDLSNITSGIHLYPNPSNGKFTLENIEGATSVKLMDLSGRVIASQPIVAGITIVDFSGVATGKYMVQISGDVINEIQPIVIE